MSAIAVRSKESLFALAIRTWLVWAAVAFVFYGPMPACGQQPLSGDSGYPPAGNPLPNFPLGTPQSLSASHPAAAAPLSLPETAHTASPVPVVHTLAAASGSTLRPQTVVLAAHSDDSPTSAADDQLTAEKIAAEIVAVDAVADIDAETKKDLLERLNKAAKWLQDEADAAKRKLELDAQIATLPETLRLAREELTKPPHSPHIDFPINATVPMLEAKLAELRLQVEADEAISKNKDDEVENRVKRISDISKELIKVEERIADAKAQLSALTSADLVSRIKQIEQKSRLRGRQQQLVTLKAEQQRLEAVTELLPLQRDLAKRSASSSKKLLQSWQTAVDTWRKEESKRQAAEARRIAENSHPALKSLATKNAEIAELRIKTAAGIERLAKTIKALEENTSQYKLAFKELKEKVEHAGATSSTGVLLLKQRDELPPASQFHSQAAFVQQAMPDAHLTLLQLNQLSREIADPAEMAGEMLSSFSESLANYDQQQVLEVVTGLLNDRRDFLSKAAIDQNTYLQDLNHLELANQALADQVREFRQYLDQRVMWIRSAEPMQWHDLKQAFTGMATLASPPRWLEVLRVSGGEFLRRPAGAIAVVSLFMLLLLGRARLLAIQYRLTEPVAADQSETYLPKVVALAIAVVLSARWPLLVMALGFRLKYAASATPWTQAVGQSCLTTMLFMWGVELLREISRRDGMAERLFRWPGKATSAIRNMLELTLLLGIPLLALLQLSQFGELAGLKGLERTLFVTAMILTAFQYGILHRPGGRLMTSLSTDEKYGDSIFVALKYPNWLVSVTAPLTLAILSASGYHFSAYQLSARLTETSGAILAVLLLHHMLLIWLDVKAHNFRAETKSQEEAAPKPVASVFKFVSDDGEEGDDDDDEMQATPLVQAQLKSYQEFRDLLRYAAIIGLLGSNYFIWDSVLPALRVLDQVELWPNIEKVVEKVVDRDGIDTIKTFERSVPTTLTDLLVAVTIFCGTLTVSARLPGLLQLTVLERIPMDHGGRQAIAILVRYAVTLIGLLVACKILHISWSSVQWLAAAMTVGLAFGLQEIFANLVSGLIILFERPIRLGDLVTVGTVTGTVSKMQMRATTITDFDRREMIVPNKTFITDNVINWTLSDPISRIVLPVGVAHGTDVQKTQAILLRIARRCTFVMNEPPPSTLFRGIGESSLNIELRVFIPKRDLYTDVVNELNNAIVREFIRYKIEIAYPQRDLHIRTAESLKPLMAGWAKSEAQPIEEQRRA